jgi:signal transduction histidine kinase
MIIEASGGRIWFESQPGQGTVFRITLPQAGMEARKGEVSIIKQWEVS